MQQVVSYSLCAVCFKNNAAVAKVSIAFSFAALKRL